MPRKSGAPSTVPGKGEIRRDRLMVFAQAYRRCWNATTAAIEAGYAEKSAHVIGCNMLARDDVQQELARLAIESEREHQLSAGQILQALSEIAYSDVTEVVRFVKVVNGRYVVALRDMPLLPLAVRRTIASFKVDATTGAVEVKFWSKTKALELLAKHAGLLNEVVKHEHTFSQEALDRMDDQTLLETTRAEAERYERHLAAMARVRRAVGELPPAEEPTNSPRTASTPSPRGAKGRGE